MIKYWEEISLTTDMKTVFVVCKIENMLAVRPRKKVVLFPEIDF